MMMAVTTTMMMIIYYIILCIRFESLSAYSSQYVWSEKLDCSFTVLYVTLFYQNKSVYIQDMMFRKAKQLRDV
jgi:hypothetical protein